MKMYRESDICREMWVHVCLSSEQSGNECIDSEMWALHSNFTPVKGKITIDTSGYIVIVENCNLYQGNLLYWSYNSILILNSNDNVTLQ